jgi:hypothetical protein
MTSPRRPSNEQTITFFTAIHDELPTRLRILWIYPARADAIIRELARIGWIAVPELTPIQCSKLIRIMVAALAAQQDILDAALCSPAQHFPLSPTQLATLIESYRVEQRRVQ